MKSMKTWTHGIFSQSKKGEEWYASMPCYTSKYLRQGPSPCALGLSPSSRGQSQCPRGPPPRHHVAASSCSLHLLKNKISSPLSLAYGQDYTLFPPFVGKKVATSPKHSRHELPFHHGKFSIGPCIL